MTKPARLLVPHERGYCLSGQGPQPCGRFAKWSVNEKPCCDQHARNELFKYVKENKL